MPGNSELLSRMALCDVKDSPGSHRESWKGKVWLSLVDRFIYLSVLMIFYQVVELGVLYNIKRRVRGDRNLLILNR